jgi:hypothetical protein
MCDMVTKNTGPFITANQSSILINPDLVWDYDIPPEAEQDEAFRRWYIARVLTRGRAEDLKAIGFDTIYKYLPSLTLPDEIRHFWEWYFSLPKVRQRYGDSHSPATPGIDGHRSDSAGS